VRARDRADTAFGRAHRPAGIGRGRCRTRARARVRARVRA
jgi:hypothetical protein